MEACGKNAFAAWLKLAKIIRTERPARAIIWGSGSGANYVFLRMACHFLVGLETALAYIELPARDTSYAIEAYPSNELAPMLERLQILSTRQCGMYAEEFRDIASRPELLRECDASGRLVLLDISRHDYRQLPSRLVAGAASRRHGNG